MASNRTALQVLATIALAALLVFGAALFLARIAAAVTILIAGKTGVGKSTLINTVFKDNFAATGQGRRVTAESREYSKEGSPLRIIDTRGLELGKMGSDLPALEKLIRQRASEADPNRRIHVAWLCIAEDSRRLTVREGEAAA